MINLKNLEVWFVTGSQHLYGEETLNKVAEHSQTIAKFLNDNPRIPVTVVFKPTVKSPEEIYSICSEANTAKKLHRNYRVDAYIFTSKNVDWRIEDFTKTIVSFAYAIQQTHSLERY